MALITSCKHFFEYSNYIDFLPDEKGGQETPQGARGANECSTAQPLAFNTIHTAPAHR